jgi:hypothetical protein
MSTDKRRYQARKSRMDSPIAPTGGKNAAADGYSIRDREPFERKRDLYSWSKSPDIAPGLRDECEAAFDSYLMD